MDFTKKYYQAIQDEITNDPMQLGYKGKTPDEIIDLLNSSYIILVPSVQTARIAVIIDQIPFAQNIAIATDVLQAQKLSPTVIPTAEEVDLQ